MALCLKALALAPTFNETTRSDHAFQLGVLITFVTLKRFMRSTLV
jgi:hypothetical protein